MTVATIQPEMRGQFGSRLGDALRSRPRWAWAVVRATDASRDPRNLTEWGRSIGVSYGALRNWCSTARISANKSLAFALRFRAPDRTLTEKDTSAAREAAVALAEQRHGARQRT